REWPGNAIGVRTTSPIPPREWHRVTVTYDGSKSARGFTIYVDGQPAEVSILRDHVEARSARSGSRGDFLIGSRFRDRGFKQGRVDGLRVFGAAVPPLEIREVVEPGSIDRALENPAAHPDRLREYFVAIDAETSQLEARLQRSRRQLIKLEEQIQTVSIMREL